jgi:hypothetical protein
MRIAMRRILLEFLMAFRPDDKPRKSKASRMRLSDLEKAQLARHIWVSHDGAVFSTLGSNNPRRLKEEQRQGGYRTIKCQLTRTRNVTFRVHRLVLWAYHGEACMMRCGENIPGYEYPDDFDVDHIDGNPSNNAAANLRPATSVENHRASRRNNLKRRSNAPEQSRPVVVSAHGPGIAPELAASFPVGTIFPSASEAARQTKLYQGNICGSMRKRCMVGGMRFESSAREGDMDLPGEIWKPEIGLWYETTFGAPVRVSSHGRIWKRHGNIKTNGNTEAHSRYRIVQIGKRRTYVHQTVYRVWNGALDKNGVWITAEIPPGMMVLHGGPARASDAERRDPAGFERNFPEDLRIGTPQDNAADIKHEKQTQTQIKRNEAGGGLKNPELSSKII